MSLILLFLPAVSCAVDWPVFFEHLGSVNSIHNKWELTFSIDTNFDEVMEMLTGFRQHVDKMRPEFYTHPSEKSGDPVDDAEGKENARELEKEKAANAERENKLSATFEEHWSKVTNILVRRADVLRKKLSDTITLGDNRIIRTDYTKKKKKRRRNKEGKGKGKGKRRVKRQSGGSGLLQLLFGVAYQDNVNQVQTKLDEIEKKLNSDVGNLVNTYNNGKDNLQREIVHTRQQVHKVESMAGQLEEKVVGMELERSELLKSGLGSTAQRTTLAIQELSAEFAEAEMFLVEVDKMIASLAGGRLSPNIVPARVLHKHLLSIEAKLPKHFSLLYPSSESLWPYYSVIPTSIYFSKDFHEMFVHISIPLNDDSNGLQLYRVHNLPLKVRDGYSVTADIDTEYLLVGRGGDYHLELSKEDFQDCQTYQKEGQQFFCGFKPLLLSAKHENCVIQLFNVIGDGAMCQSRLNHGLVQPFNRLYNGSWVFAAITAQVPVVMQCPNATIPTSLLGFGVINLMEGCTLSSDEYMYPHTFSGFSDISLSMDMVSTQVGDVDGDSSSELSGEDLHQIGTIDDYDNSFETMIISAVVAEEDEDGLAGTLFDPSENYLPADFVPHGYSSTVRAIEDDEATVTEEDQTEEADDETTTKISVETSINMISSVAVPNGPADKTADADAEMMMTTEREMQTEHGDKTADLVMVTKSDFSPAINLQSNETAVNDVVNNILNLVPEDPETVTEVHHEMLVKLKDKISRGKHWLDAYNKRKIG